MLLEKCAEPKGLSPRGANGPLSARSQRASLRAEPTGLCPRGANDLCVRGEDMHWSAQVRGEDQYSSAQVRRRIHVNMYV